eukprot:3941884-Rhodomonas_salina.1
MDDMEALVQGLASPLWALVVIAPVFLCIRYRCLQGAAAAGHNGSKDSEEAQEGAFSIQTPKAGGADETEENIDDEDILGEGHTADLHKATTKDTNCYP